MPTSDIQTALGRLFAELTHGAPAGGGAFVLNSGDLGLLRSLDALTAAEASVGLDGGATIAAHATHLRAGLALMNRWAREGGDPFADASWDAAWEVASVTDPEWEQARRALRAEVDAWAAALVAPRELSPSTSQGMIASIAHLAYHLGAIRQIGRRARGPRAGTFT